MLPDWLEWKELNPLPAVLEFYEESAGMVGSQSASGTVSSRGRNGGCVGSVGRERRNHRQINKVIPHGYIMVP